MNSEGVHPPSQYAEQRDLFGGQVQACAGTGGLAADQIYPQLGNAHLHRVLGRRCAGSALVNAPPVRGRKTVCRGNRQRQVQAFDAIAGHVHGVALFRQTAVQIVRGFSSSSIIRTRMTPPQSVVASTGCCAGVGLWNSRSSHKYMTGVVKSVSAWLTSKPPTTAIPSGWRNSAPVP